MKMCRSMVCALAVAGSLIAVGWSQETTPPSRQLGENVGRTTGNGDATSTDSERAFAALVISHARLSREVNTYVAQKATNPEIKKLSQQISTDQKEFSDKVQAAAKRDGYTVNPDLMLPRDQAILDFMKELPVGALERTYIFHLAGDNTTHMLQAQWVAKNAQKPAVKQAAEEMVATLQAREKTIDDLAKQEVNTPPAKGGTE